MALEKQLQQDVMALAHALLPMYLQPDPHTGASIGIREGLAAAVFSATMILAEFDHKPATIRGHRGTPFGRLAYSLEKAAWSVDYDPVVPGPPEAEPPEELPANVIALFRR